MKRLIVPVALVAMAGLLFAAIAVDCVRLAGAARERVELADAEMKKHELRLARLLAAAPNKVPETDAAVSAFDSASDSHARHEAYDRLVAIARSVQSQGIDPTNPLDRRFMDDIAGAINRREVARKQYDDEWAAYQQFLKSVRGSVAKLFSSHTRAE
jgi:hypothetical protein